MRKIKNRKYLGISIVLLIFTLIIAGSVYKNFKLKKNKTSRYEFSVSGFKNMEAFLLFKKGDKILVNSQALKRSTSKPFPVRKYKMTEREKLLNKAEGLFKQALKLDPENFILNERYFSVLHLQKKFDEALISLKKLFNLGMERIEYYQKLVQLYKATKNENKLEVSLIEYKNHIEHTKNIHHLNYLIIFLLFEDKIKEADRILTKFELDTEFKENPDIKYLRNQINKIVAKKTSRKN